MLLRRAFRVGRATHDAAWLKIGVYTEYTCNSSNVGKPPLNTYTHIAQTHGMYIYTSIHHSYKYKRALCPDTIIISSVQAQPSNLSKILCLVALCVLVHARNFPHCIWVFVRGTLAKNIYTCGGVSSLYSLYIQTRLAIALLRQGPRVLVLVALYCSFLVNICTLKDLP